MSSQYFGFEEDETIAIDTDDHNSRTVITRKIKKITEKEPSPEKIPISDIQALLSQDLSVCDSTIDSSLNESSFYADENTSLYDARMNLTMEESFCTDEIENTPNAGKKFRKVAKSKNVRKNRNVLEAIENQNVTPTSKFNKSNATPGSSTKFSKKNLKPRKTGKRKFEELQNENDEKKAEELNQQFKNIQNHRLVVEFEK